MVKKRKVCLYLSYLSESRLEILKSSRLEWGVKARLCEIGNIVIFIFTLSGLGHAHLGTNSPHIDVAHIALAKIDAKYIAVNCSCILLKFKSDMSHINSRIQRCK